MGRAAPGRHRLRLSDSLDVCRPANRERDHERQGGQAHGEHDPATDAMSLHEATPPFAGATAANKRAELH